MRIAKWDTHAHGKIKCTCAFQISFCYAHAHLILLCACASHFAMCKRISFCMLWRRASWGQECYQVGPSLQGGSCWRLGYICQFSFLEWLEPSRQKTLLGTFTREITSSHIQNGSEQCRCPEAGTSNITNNFLQWVEEIYIGLNHYIRRCFSSVIQIEHMMKFIEQEAKEKVEEIDAKVGDIWERLGKIA